MTAARVIEAPLPVEDSRKVRRHAYLSPASRLVTLDAPIGAGQTKPGTEKAPAKIGETRVFELLMRRAWNVASPEGIAPGVERVQGNASPGRELPFRSAAPLAEALARVSRTAERYAWMRDFVLTLGGDHSVAAGSINGLSRAWENLGVIWVDAHADFNTPATSPSGNFHGMPLAALCGAFPLARVPGFEWFAPRLAPQDVVLVGVRAIDDGEANLLRGHGMRCYSTGDVASKGMAWVTADAISYLLSRGPRPLHLSFDIDALDASLVPGTGTPEPDGLSLDDALALCVSLHETGLLVGMDLVEVNTDLEVPERPEDPAGLRTLRCVASVLLAALGRGPRGQLPSKEEG